MAYRTRVYIAGDWTSDRNLIDRLRQWNESDYWSLSFSDAHDLTQARDSSLPCSIKRSLRERLEGSKTFVLIAGAQTKLLTKGGCRYCSRYDGRWHDCQSGYSVDQRSFIEFECDYALEHGLKVVVLYNSTRVDRNKCPDALRYTGTHVAAGCVDRMGTWCWNYPAIRKALEG